MLAAAFAADGALTAALLRALVSALPGRESGEAAALGSLTSHVLRLHAARARSAECAAGGTASALARVELLAALRAGAVDASAWKQTLVALLDDARG